MSAELLVHRATEDFHKEIENCAAILAESRQATLDELRFQQGMIGGLKLAATLLADRARNLHAMG